jgi:polyisoprenoid-binding protein YceI
MPFGIYENCHIFVYTIIVITFKATIMTTTKKWSLDPTHSEIGFKIRHLMITNVSGSFEKFNVNAETEGDDFSKAKISFSADTNSVSTNNEQRDQHLRSADFFDAETYPELKFESTGMRSISANEFELTGDLTIRNVTKPVKLGVEYGGLMKDPWGNLKAGFTLNGKINRKEWDLNWNAALETGGILVGEEVKINAEIQMLVSQ